MIGMRKWLPNSMPHFILVMMTGTFSFLLEGNDSHMTWPSSVGCLDKVVIDFRVETNPVFDFREETQTSPKVQGGEKDFFLEKN